MRLVQLQQGDVRRVGLVAEPWLRLLTGTDSVYALALAALVRDVSISTLVAERLSEEQVAYDPIDAGTSPWRCLVPINHPADPARCLVSGTGLTHLGSAMHRAAMHGTGDAEMTDSMRMFRSGLAGGRPRPGEVGTAPEWFFKGVGTVLRGPGEPLVIPSYAEDGGEEAELAGVYIIDAQGQPRRIGMTTGNEFSDHRFEKANYLNLAGSKLRTCAIGPELVVDPDFTSVAGTVTIERQGRPIWTRSITTGEAGMCHSLANLEDHHFKFEAHRRPGDLHVHYFGAHSLSFGEGLQLEDGDVMVIQFDGFGRALRNPVRVDWSTPRPVTVQPIG